ncbi:MAG: chitobiase/beta-hexosaminidase C-terminal domain-containing protein [Bacteroidales bacterium]|nr:chitobiase/beta-hexosaminidase C-terminal domain-containing protein [Bacteroidales bacterium]
MKIVSIISFLVILALPGFSQPDPAVYYAASRLDYYTSEEVGEILVYVPARLKGHKINIDLVFEYESLNKGYPAASNGISTVPFPMERLRQGQNEITVSFYEGDKWIDSRKVWITVRPHRDNAVKIDRATGGLSVAGLPFFPFGFYTYFPVLPTMPEEEAVKGFNLISPYQKIGKKSLKDRKAYMDRCASLGMKVNYNLCSVTGGCGVGSSRLPGLSRHEKLEMLRKEVEKFRDHPALLAWYIADEPDGQDLPPDSLLETYRLIKELDPYHPVSVVFMSPRKAADYRDVMDIAMTDPYPIPQGKVVEVTAYVDLLKKAYWLEKPVWVVPQAFGGNEWWQREPDPREIRVMTWLTIIHGATGVQYFIRSGPNSFPKSTAMWDECGAMALEIAELTPDINSPHPAPALTSDDPHIHAKAWNRAGLVTIAVVNARNEPGEFKLKMEDLDFTIEADVFFENRKIQIKEGVIEDIIDGYGTRVYRFDARNKPDRMKGLMPGNLTVDPGFENLSTVGVPAACYVYAGDDRGNTYFIDSRRFQQGEHSLRLNNPSVRPGARLSFYSFEPEENKSYTISIMARSGQSSNQPGRKKGGPVRFRLALGTEERTFNCSENWQKFEINAVQAGSQAEGNSRLSPQLEMAGKGTAWFDLLQVYPDMEMVARSGEEGKGSIIELKSIHPEAKIYYTIDGSEPSTGSLPYMIPVEIDNTILFKAAAYKDGIRVGYIEEKVSP